MDPVIYNNLLYGGLNQYQYMNWDNRDEIYFKRVYIGCVRAADYIFSMDEFDGENLIVYGGSQGGALAIVTAALDPQLLNYSVGTIDKKPKIHLTMMS